MRILLAVDGSPSSDRARDLVAALPWGQDDAVLIVSVVPTPDTGIVDDGALQTYRDALESAEGEIRSVRSDLAIETILLSGRAASLIIEEARAMPADLVVIGHRGHGRWESILLGSVSAEVVDHAPCAVLVARSERLGPVILADDRSIHARAAASFLLGSRLLAGLPVTVVTVDEAGFPYSASVPLIVYDEVTDTHAYGSAAQRHATQTDCAAVARQLGDAGFQADSEVRQGDPAHEIVLSAGRRGAGLVVVGTRGQTGLRRLILGSVARKVLLHAECSVLIVRGGPHLSPPAASRREDPELVSPFG